MKRFLTNKIGEQEIFDYTMNLRNDRADKTNIEIWKTLTAQQSELQEVRKELSELKDLLRKFVSTD